MRSGVLIYTVLNGLIGLVVLASGGRVEPHEYDLKEYWSWKGPARAPWFVRAIRKRREKKGNRLDDDNVYDDADNYNDNDDDEARIATGEFRRTSSKNELPLAVLKDRITQRDVDSEVNWRRETV